MPRAVAFGLGVAMMGIAVGFSVIMWLVITTGTLVPLVTMRSETTMTTTGMCVVAGFVAILASIVVVATGQVMNH